MVIVHVPMGSPGVSPLSFIVFNIGILLFGLYSFLGELLKLIEFSIGCGWQ